jgi:hypothetical protein
MDAGHRGNGADSHHHAAMGDGGGGGGGLAPHAGEGMHRGGGGLASKPSWADLREKHGSSARLGVQDSARGSGMGGKQARMSRK